MGCSSLLPSILRPWFDFLQAIATREQYQHNQIAKPMADPSQQSTPIDTATRPTMPSRYNIQGRSLTTASNMASAQKLSIPPSQALLP